MGAAAVASGVTCLLNQVVLEASDLWVRRDLWYHRAARLRKGKGRMHGTVKFFAALREAVGRPEVEWELAEGATVETLIAHLDGSVPGLGSWAGRAWIAVNRRYAGRDTRLQDGDEVAFFPPVSGG